ncbi:1803_t:CDS:2, partial [Ambispora leptoticha]
TQGSQQQVSLNGILCESSKSIQYTSYKSYLPYIISIVEIGIAAVCWYFLYHHELIFERRRLPVTLRGISRESDISVYSEDSRIPVYNDLPNLAWVLTSSFLKRKRKFVPEKIKEKGLYLTKPETDNVKETWEEKFKLSNGIFVDKYSFEQTIDSVIDHQYSLKPTIEYKKLQNMRISHVSEIYDSLLLSEGIEFDANSSEDIKNFFMFFNMNPRRHSENALETYDVYCEIASEQVSIEYDIQNIKISEKFKVSIEEALESNKPIEDLKLVFNKFGHLFATKIIIGNKLQRLARLNGKKNENESKRPIDETANEFLSLWKKEIYPYDSSYLLTMNGDPIKINQIQKWLEIVPVFETEWGIIKRVVIPLYKILDIKQQKEIEKLFSKKDHILMLEETTILDFNAEYQRIEFNSKLKSNKYQIFGNVVDTNDKTIASIYMKFSLKSEYGFSVNWIQVDDKNSQTSYKLKWMLIGCPSEIGYFDSTTRDKEIKTGSTELEITFKKKSALENVNIAKHWTCQINIDKPLSPSSFVLLNIEYPIARKTPIFKASCQRSQESNSIIDVKVEPIKDVYVEFLNEDEENTVTIRWCAFY